MASGWAVTPPTAPPGGSLQPATGWGHITPAASPLLSPRSGHEALVHLRVSLTVTLGKMTDISINNRHEK